MNEIEEEQLKVEIKHIFDSGANEIRILEMIKSFLNSRPKPNTLNKWNLTSDGVFPECHSQHRDIFESSPVLVLDVFGESYVDNYYKVVDLGLNNPRVGEEGWSSDFNNSLPEDKIGIFAWMNIKLPKEWDKYNTDRLNEYIKNKGS